jgi:hypothetical protein
MNYHLDAEEFFALPDHLKTMLEGKQAPGKAIPARQVDG